jgi:hypothetical protein
MLQEPNQQGVWVIALVVEPMAFLVLFQHLSVCDCMVRVVKFSETWTRANHSWMAHPHTVPCTVCHENRIQPLIARDQEQYGISPQQV